MCDLDYSYCVVVTTNVLSLLLKGNETFFPNRQNAAADGPYGNKGSYTGLRMCVVYLNMIYLNLYFCLKTFSPGVFGSQLTVTVILLGIVLTWCLSSSWKTGAAFSFNLFTSLSALINARLSTNIQGEHMHTCTQPRSAIPFVSFKHA